VALQQARTSSSISHQLDAHDPFVDRNGRVTSMPAPIRDDSSRSVAILPFLSHFAATVARTIFEPFTGKTGSIGSSLDMTRELRFYSSA